MKNFSNRKGFTLVELLIVIVVIGVLSAMMMLSSTEAVSSAKAADVISNLRNIKTAVLAWYADNLDRVNGKYQIYKKDGTDPQLIGTFTKDKGGEAEFLKYLNNDNSIKLTKKESAADGEYFLSGEDGGKNWYVGYKTNDTKIKEKLESRASSVGLTGGAQNGLTVSPYSASRGDYIGMLIQKLAD